MSSKEAITDFNRAVLKAYQCTSKTVSLADARVIGRLLKLNWYQVHDFFWRNRNKRIGMPDVTPETRKSIDEIKRTIKKEIDGICRYMQHEQPHSSRKSFQLNVLETRFRQGSRITSLECHLIAKHFDLEGETITNWFRNRRRSKQEADSNFVMAPKALELLEVINKEVKKQRHFNMTLSQGNCLGKRYSISPSLSREERITMSKTIGVPEYWIKWWFAKRNKIERRRKERAARATGSGKERRSERTPEPSSASELSEVQSEMSNTEDWFEKMTTVVSASPEIFQLVDPFFTPTSTQFATSPVNSTSSVLVNQSFPSERSSASEPSSVQSVSDSEDWFEKMGSNVPSASHASFPAHQVEEPWLPRSETVSNAHDWTFQHHEMCPNSSNNRFPKPSIDLNYQRDNNYPVAQQQDPDHMLLNNPCFFNPLNTNESAQPQAAHEYSQASPEPPYFTFP